MRSEAVDCMVNIRSVWSEWLLNGIFSHEACGREAEDG